MNPDPRADRRYQLAPLDTSGVFLGLSVLQAVLLGGGILATVASLTAGAPLPVAALPVAAATVLALDRIRGQALADWIPAAASWHHTRLQGRRHWHQPLPLLPHDPDNESPSAPPILAGIRIRAVPWRNRRIGAVDDRHHGTLTAVIPVAGNGFVTESAADQERTLAGWGDLLAQFASEGGVVTHLGWSDLARPSGLSQHRAWLNTTDRPDHPAARASYDELLTTAAGGATTHDTVVTITVARHRLSRRHRTASPAALEQALAGTVDSLLRALQTAGLTAGAPYSPHDLHRLLRTRIDPLRPTTTGLDGTLTDRLARTTAATSMPVVVEAEWSQLCTDDTYHRTWWIGTWPRLPVPAGWMEPFLAAGGITRAVTVALTPVPAHQSRRRIERDLVKLESDAVTKQDKGRRVDARHHRATRALLEREEELVAGYAEVAYLGLITVTAPDPDTLEDHSEIIEQLAREHGMDLRVLHGRQDLAWAAALPLGIAPTHTLTS